MVAVDTFESPTLRPQAIGGLVIALAAVAVGAGWLVGALRLRAGRAGTSGATYRSLGGPVYTAVQIGCSAILILLGLALLGIVLFVRR
jgi:hypothetical protein